MMKMENSKQNLKSILKYYLLYILTVLIAVPAIVYLLFFIADKYLSVSGASPDATFNSGIADDISLILGNLVIIWIFIKKKYTSLTLPGGLSLSPGRSKSLFLWAFILQLSSILPINIFVAFLDLNDYSTAVAADGTLSIAGIIGISLLAPLAEELVMRGGIEEKLLQRRCSATLAIVLSSFLFAILHLSPSLVIGAFLNGVLYGWVYYISRNVLACFLMHMTNNAFSCVADILQFGESAFSDSMLPVKIMLVSLIVLAISVWKLKMSISGQKNATDQIHK